eukprot:gene9932-11761_t
MKQGDAAAAYCASHWTAWEPSGTDGAQHPTLAPGVYPKLDEADATGGSSGDLWGGVTVQIYRAPAQLEQTLEAISEELNAMMEALGIPFTTAFFNDNEPSTC